jgi:CRISPR-associated protein Cmr5
MATDTDKKVTLDQQRARHAWDTVKRVPETEWDDFDTQAKKLPTRIMASGLGQALAFLEAKKYTPSLREALAGWLHVRRPVEDGKDKRIVVRVIFGDAEFIRFATAETLAYLQWLVRFTEAKSKEREEQAKKKGTAPRQGGKEG